MSPTHRNILWFVYDGECPLCSAAARLYRIRRAVGDVKIIDARSDHDHPVLQRILSMGYQLDRGMVIHWNGTFYQGSEALTIMALLGSSLGWYNRLNAMLFRSSFVSTVMYPGLRAGRNLLLKFKGVAPLGKP